MLLRSMTGLMTLFLFSTMTLGQASSEVELRVRWNPLYDIIVIADLDGNISLIDVSSDKILNELSVTSLRGISHILNLSWSPNGQRLAVQDGFDVQIWEHPWNRSEARLISTFRYYTYPPMSEADVDPRAFAWHPDNSWFSTVTGGYINVWNADTNELIYRFTGDQVGTYDLAWSEEGILASGGSLGLGIVWDLSNGLPKYYFNSFRRGQVQSPVIHSISWNKDGTLLALGTDGGSIHIWDTSVGHDSSYDDDVGSLIATDMSYGTRNPIISVSWSPDGEYIASGDDDGNLRIHDVETRELVQLVKAALGTKIYDVTWSPYGGRLAFISGGNAASQNLLSSESGRLFSGAVQIITPVASLQRLNDLLDTCEVTDMQVTEITHLQDFVTQLDTLSEDELPSSCREDILALAQAVAVEEN